MNNLFEKGMKPISVMRNGNSLVQVFTRIADNIFYGDKLKDPWTVHDLKLNIINYQ